MNNRQDKLPWSQEIWDRIHKAVHAECRRIKIASKFLPLYGPVPDAVTVPADTILTDQAKLFINEVATVPLIESWVEFTLTAQQVKHEMDLMTAHTLATRAANFLSQAQDLLLFQGDAARDKKSGSPLFTQNKVRFRSGPAGTGLSYAPLDDDQIVEVLSLEPCQQRFGERTFEAVAEGYARLQDRGHYGPYALVLHTVPYADTYAPLPATLIMPADRIKPLVGAGFYGTGTLPPLTGLLLSLGGNSMDLVVGQDATASFMQEDAEGRNHFRVSERFALRLKDKTAIIKLAFDTQPHAAESASKKPE